MIRVSLLLGALSLTAMTPSAPAFADAPNPPDHGYVDFCKYIVPIATPDLSVGNCIGSRTTSYYSLEGWSEHVCFYYQNVLPDQFYAVYEDYNECVRDKASQI